MRMLGVLAALVACAPVEKLPETEPIPYQLDRGGVQLVGRDLRIDFGRTDHSTIPAMTKLVGRPPISTRLCADGGEVVTWPDGTGLVFADGAFRGWVSATQSEGAGLICTPVG